MPSDDEVPAGMNGASGHDATNGALVLPKTPLPPSANALIDYRVKAAPNLPNELDRAVRQFFDEPGMKRWLEARTDAESIEGSCYEDDRGFLRDLRDKAKKAGGYPILSGSKMRDMLGTFHRSTVGRRFKDLNRYLRLEKAQKALAQQQAAAASPPSGTPPPGE